MEGESEHWAVNVGAGMRKALPVFIKDRKDRQAFMRSVDMGAAKYALGKRDTLENERRVAERAKNGYYLDNDITFTDKDGNIVETFTEGFNRLNEREVAAIQAQKGIELTPLNVWLEGVKAQQARAVATAKSLSDRKYYSTKIQIMKIPMGPDLTADVPVQYLDADAVLKYKETADMPRMYLPNGGAALNSVYFGEKDKLEYFSVLSDTARNILEGEDNLTGFQSLMGKARDAFSAYMPGNSGANDFFTTVDPNSEEGVALRERLISSIVKETGRSREEVEKSFVSNKEDHARVTAQSENFYRTGNLSRVASYNTVLRMLAIQMAPILLGESGKTISDGDRRLIANALGLAENAEGNWQFVSSSFISEDQLKARLSLIQHSLDRAHKTLDERYKLGWVQLGYNITSLEGATPEQLAAAERLAADPSQKTEAAYGGRTFKREIVDDKPVYTFG
jgi:hypothetical protein